MDANGLFILRAPPALRRDATGALICADFKVGEPARAPAKGWMNELVVRWKGPGVESFCAIHAATLRPGRALQIKFDRVRYDEQTNAIVAHITKLDLAPLSPSWEKHAAQHITTDADVAASID